jgi:hypothetical protein
VSDETLPAVVPEEPELPAPTAAEARSTQVARGLGMGDRGVIFTNVAEAVAYATACFNSRLLPDHIKNGQQAFVIMDNGRELGLRPWASWKVIYITRQGRIALMSKGALAVAQASPRFENYEERIELEGTEEMRAVAVAKARGFKPVEKTFSMADAKAAGLLDRKRSRDGREYDGPWQAYLKDMLLARARDRALAIAFAAELAGIELETLAEDADRLEAGAKPALAPAAIVGVPKEAAADGAPKALPEGGQPDPLLLHVLGQKQPTELPKRVQAQDQPKVARATEEAGPKAAAVTAGGGPVRQGAPRPVVEGEPATRDQAEIDKSVDEAFPTLAKAMDHFVPLPSPEAIGRGVDQALKTIRKRGGKERHEYKVGDIVLGTRRVVEVSEGGIPIVEKLSDEEIAELKRAANPSTDAKDPTQPPYPAHRAEDGNWYCDEHNAYGCPPCAAVGQGEPERPKFCPRTHCGKPLNLLGDCDNCGWPNARFE